MAHKKGVGSSKNGRESHAQRLGVKIFGGVTILALTLLWARTTLSMLSLMEPYSSGRVVSTAVL